MKTFYKLKKNKKEVAFISEFKIEPKIDIESEEDWRYGELEQSEIDGCYYLAGFAPQKTESEKQKEAAQDELQTVDAQLKEQDELSIRNICSMLINPKDLFAINKLKEREKIKEQLRARRKELEKIINDASV